MLGVWCVYVVLYAYGADVGACGFDEACVGCCMCVVLMRRACVADEVSCVGATRVYNVTVPYMVL